VVVALAAVAAGFGMPGVATEPGSPVSRRGLVGLVTAFVCLSVFPLGHGAGPPWLAGLVMLASLVTLGGPVVRWQLPAGAVGAGWILVYAWVGLANAAEQGAGAVVEQAGLVALVLGVLVAFARHRHRADQTATTPGRQISLTH
jgi:hypothetical protein